MNSHRRSRPPGFALLVALTFVALASAQVTLAADGSTAPAAPPRFPLGKLIEGVASQGDPTQTYTLYLPSSYSPDRVWPTLLILDPGGRSREAAEVFRDAAETYGWVLLSSNDTRNGAPKEQNLRALRAMWPEAGRRWSPDPKRLYAAGFSAGGIMAWGLARSIGDVAGVIATGARWDAALLGEKVGVPGWGSAGDTDFNYPEMQDIHEALGRWGTPHRLEIFVGGHSWMPPELAREAIEWMEVQGMREERRPLDRTLVERLAAADLAKAETLATGGDHLAAMHRYEAIARTYAGLVDVATATARAAELRGGREVKEAEREARKWDAMDRQHTAAIGRAVSTLTLVESTMTSGQLERELRLSELRGRAKKPGYEGVVARRMLARTLSSLGVYTGDFMARKDWGAAEIALEVMTELAPDRWPSWYNLACAEARQGREGQALDHLDRAVAAGFTDAKAMVEDPDLERLREEPRFTALATRLASAAPAP